MLVSKFALHLGVAFLLGASIGSERQFRQRMAGLRTNTLVATGALFVLLSTMVPVAIQIYQVEQADAGGNFATGTVL